MAEERRPDAPEEKKAGRAAGNAVQVQVRCYSGHTYAERPQSFTWQGRKIAVEEVLDAWRGPAGPAFRVRTMEGIFVLAYEEAADRWQLQER